MFYSPTQPPPRLTHLPNMMDRSRMTKLHTVVCSMWHILPSFWTRASSWSFLSDGWWGSIKWEWKWRSHVSGRISVKKSEASKGKRVDENSMHVSKKGMDVLWQIALITHLVYAQIETNAQAYRCIGVDRRYCIEKISKTWCGLIWCDKDWNWLS